MWNKEHGCLKIGGKLGILEVEITESRFFNFGGRHLSYFHKRTFGFLGTGAQSWRRALCKLWDFLIRLLQVDALQAQPTTPTDVAPLPQSMANHTSKCLLSRYAKSVHYTLPLTSYSCAYSCVSPAHGCTYSRGCSVWSSRSVSVSLSSSSIPRNYRAAATQEDDEAATTRHKRPYNASRK